jgi:transcriptional regulator
MYTPAHFQVHDRDALLELIEAHAFGLLACAGDDGEIEAAHLPFLLERHAEGAVHLHVHVARRNPLAELAAAGRRMTAVFQGPHAYVSPRWYRDPHRQVPTWNYTAVHAHGPTRTLSAEELRARLAALTDRHEGGAWRLADLEASTLGRLERGIVGITLEVERLEGKAKLSQNRELPDREGVGRGLAARQGPGDAEIAGLMGAVVARRDDLVISTDPGRIDLDQVMAFMRQSYWAPDEERERMARAIAHCFCFGVYREDGSRGGRGQQIALARVVTDHATFSYLGDVFVDPSARGHGVGTWLVETIYAQPTLQVFRRHLLFTKDAHGLYEKVGFTPLAEPRTAMERKG